MRHGSRLFVAVAALFAAGAVVAKQREAKLCSFLPENDLKIPVGSVEAQGIEKNQFDEVLDRVQKVYEPIFKEKGATLAIERRWDDATVNAQATQREKKWIIRMFGGLARHKVVTQDGFAVVACHEIGHHLGGFPRVNDWASNEGQSDYFANTKCLRRLFGDNGAQAFTRMGGEDPIAIKACAAAYPNGGNDEAMCLRASMAGISLASLLNELSKGKTDPKLDTPDTNKVSSTNNAHPAAQCRLDTYFQAALCTKPAREDFDPKDPNPGACTRSQGFTVGIRPLCWYKPPESEPSFDKVALGHGRPAVNPAAALSLLQSSF